MILSEAFYALVHLKEPPLSPLPPSVGCILYEVVVVYLIANITFAHQRNQSVPVKFREKRHPCWEA